MLILLAALIACWFSLMLSFGGDIYAVMGPFALVVCITLCALRGSAIRAWLRFTPLAVTTGLGVGVVMTFLTYPIYSLFASHQPALQGQVQDLYVAAHRTTVLQALLWVFPIMVAEELLWRGVLLEALGRRISPAAAIPVSIITYAAAQLGSGSWLVAFVALVCGTIWSLQRHFTRSLLSPLLAHFIWTPTVIFLHPVT